MQIYAKIENVCQSMQNKAINMHCKEIYVYIYAFMCKIICNNMHKICKNMQKYAQNKQIKYAKICTNLTLNMQIICTNMQQHILFQRNMQNYAKLCKLYA